MPGNNLRVQRVNGVSNSSRNASDYNIEEAMGKLRIQTDEKQDETGSMAYPDRPGEPDCIYYLRTGMCGYGNNCRFNHPTIYWKDNLNGGDLPERVGEPDCVYFLKTGTCKYRSTCKFNHPRDRHGAGTVALNMAGLPMRQGQKSCPYYLRAGSCKFGVTCKFHHPQPAVDGQESQDGPNPPLLGPSLYAPSSAPPVTGGFPQWPYSHPQTYLPVILPSSGPAQGWSPYIGNMSPIFGTNGYGSIDHVYQSIPSYLPERPSEPRCRYFMNTGTCKYGSDCKYHHPKEKMVESVASSLSPFGLPLRPGQPMCLYYSLYGMCRYGSGCKYDHPLVAYTYNYTTGLTGQPMVDPLLSYGGINSPSSPSKSWKNASWTSERISNVKLCEDESSGEHVGSSHSSPQNESE